MASIEQLAKRRMDAVNKLSESKTQISELLGVEFPERPFIKPVDGIHDEIYKLEAIAEDVETIANALAEKKPKRTTK